MKKPIVALIPSGYKASKLYTPVPINGEGDFTTTRASVAYRMNKDGYLEEIAASVPRLDYSDSKCPSLLLEGASTNYLTNSGQLDLSLNPTRLTIEANKNIAPDGTLTASKMESFDLDSFGNFLTTSAGILTDRTFTFSVWLWTDEGKDKEVRLFLISSSESGSSNITITNIPTKYEFTFSFTSITVDSNLQVRIALVSNNTYIYAWGGQLEESEVATSYIKTTGSSATRIKDTCNDSGDLTLWNNLNKEGSWYFNIKPINDGVTFKSITISDATSDSRVLLRQDADYTYRFYLLVGGVAKTTLTANLDQALEWHKIAVRWKQDNVQIFLNGIEVATDTTVDLTGALDYDEFAFDNGGGSQQWTGSVKEAMIWDEYLTDEELIGITTL